MDEDPLDLGRQAFQIGEVHDADRPPADLVLVAGPMPRLVVPILPAPAAASRNASSSRCSGRISVAFSATAGFRGDRDAERLDAARSRRPAPRGRRRRRSRSPTACRRARRRKAAARACRSCRRPQGWARIMAALEAHHDVGALRQPVDDLTLALVAPLGPDDRDIGHDEIL